MRCPSRKGLEQRQWLCTCSCGDQWWIRWPAMGQTGEKVLLYCVFFMILHRFHRDYIRIRMEKRKNLEDSWDWLKAAFPDQKPCSFKPIQSKKGLQFWDKTDLRAYFGYVWPFGPLALGIAISLEVDQRREILQKQPGWSHDIPRVYPMGSLSWICP